MAERTQNLQQTGTWSDPETETAAAVRDTWHLQAWSHIWGGGVFSSQG